MNELILPIVGMPNVGKSTLINMLLGSKVSVVTNKPHTTRTLINFNTNDQAYIMDTPGIEKVKGKLGNAIYEYMQNFIKDYDKLILVLDAFNPKIENFKHVISKCIIVINKIDYIRKPKLLLILHELQQYNPIEVFMICAKTGDGIDTLKNYLIQNNYIKSNLKEVQENYANFACECVREKMLIALNKEIPYKILIIPKKVKIMEKNSWEIELNIIVPKKNYKQIILGKKGSKIKEIGIAARMELIAKFKQNGSLFLNIIVDEKLWERKESYETLGWEIK